MGKPPGREIVGPELQARLRVDLRSGQEDNEYSYEGNELELFERATEWRTYWTDFVAPYLGERVLEVGAGIGSVTAKLCLRALEWVALEPDRALAHVIVSRVQHPHVKVINAKLERVSFRKQFDTVIYADVLEHIQDDFSELSMVSRHIKTGGHLIVLVPAHQFLFSAFDKSVGHFRRYSRTSLMSSVPATLECVEMKQIDSLGFFLQLANKMFGGNVKPNASTIRIWDGIFIPFSRSLDSLVFRFRLGKSIFAVFKKQP